MASFERSSRVGFTSSASMLLEVSTTRTRSIPLRSRVSQCIPFCGRASATKARATATVVTTTRSHLRTRDGAEAAIRRRPPRSARARDRRTSARTSNATSSTTMTAPARSQWGSSKCMVILQRDDGSRNSAKARGGHAELREEQEEARRGEGREAFAVLRQRGEGASGLLELVDI